MPLMQNEFTAIIERDGKWFVAFCAEVPGANGQGRTKAAARKNLTESIRLILDDRREDALRALPKSAVRETVIVS
jgi:predicted RNase H-like HicB family nuclease